MLISQRPDGGDTPIGLVYMAALLLKHGFVTFADLLPFVSQVSARQIANGKMAPDDASMTKIRDDHIASLSKTSGPQNALTKAVLVDEDTPATSNNAAEQTGPPPKPPPEQRIQLLQALLAIGHMPPALYLLGKAPWLAQYYPAIADLIMRIVERNIEPIYRANQQEWADAIQGDEDLAAAEMELMLDAPASHYRPKQKRIVKTLWSPTPADTPTTRFEFFYPDWAEGQGHWETIHDVREKGLAWLGLIRGLGGRNAEVMIKLCRVGQVHFTRLRKEREDAVLGRRATSRADARAIEVSLFDDAADMCSLSADRR
jgi:THO complex subunit 2